MSFCLAQEKTRGRRVNVVFKASKLNLACLLHMQLTESKSMQALCQIYAAVSYICIGDSESSTQVKSSCYFVYIASVCCVIWSMRYTFISFVIPLFHITELKFGNRHLT